RALANGRGLDFDYIASSCWVHSDPALLRRIVQNFLSNAVRYTRSGRIALGCRRYPGCLQIQVRDTGSGIAADQLEHIFEEFHRGCNAADNDRGLGLGLSLADRMARLLSHEIHVRSTVGHGTLFAIDVERTAALPETPRQPAPRRPSSDAQLTPLQLLCVDDDAASLTALNGLLQSWGMQVIMRHGMAARRDGPSCSEFDAAIVDYNLGDDQPSGLDVIEALLHDGGPSCILITADRDQTVRERARALGVAILYKPIAPAKLRAVLGHVQAQRQKA